MTLEEYSEYIRLSIEANPAKGVTLRNEVSKVYDLEEFEKFATDRINQYILANFDLFKAIPEKHVNDMLTILVTSVTEFFVLGANCGEKR